jgi:hypothetical protein
MAAWLMTPLTHTLLLLLRHLLKGCLLLPNLLHHLRKLCPHLLKL